MKIKKNLLSIIPIILFLFNSRGVSAMNIIFEGIDASGKTTLLSAFERMLFDNKESFYSVDELEESPLRGVLKNMFDKDPFLLSKKDFKTSIYETLVLSADCRYKQEYFNKYTNRINVFDRDFLTILAYQKCILQRDYGENFSEFYEPFKKLMLFDLKTIKTVVYLKVPIETSIQRILKRGRGQPYTQEQIDMLIKVKNCYENELIPELMSMGIDVTILDGTAPPEVNAEKIYKKIKGL